MPTRINKPKASKRPSRSRSRAASGELPTTYTAAIRYLMDHTDLERTRPSRVDPSVFKLDRMRALMKKLGDPQEQLRTVHVAGTNGKGSVVAMTAAAVQSCGYAVGTYTSPHLVDITERIQINNTPITKPAFAGLINRVAEAAQGVPKKFGSHTFFELLTAAAFLHLAEKAVDVAIIEVGMGGLYDSTNIITPEVCAVTRIGLDHKQFLGETIGEIAGQKAGIFKPGVPAISVTQDEEAEAVLRETAENVGTSLQVVSKDIEYSQRFEASPQLGPHCRIGITTDRVNFEHVPVPLPGEHQAPNCGLALSIVDRLIERGFELPEARVFEGLSSTVHPGRMELIEHEPRILLDGAHNPESLESLIRCIGAHIKYDSMVMIFGANTDKDNATMLEKIGIGADKIIFTRTKNNPRAAEPEELAAMLDEEQSKMYQIAPNLDEALSIAGRAAKRDDLIVITGSFYLVGEAKKMLAQRAERAAVAMAGA